MNDLTIFRYESNEVRTVQVDGQPYWVAKDVATVLGYKDQTNAIKQHCRGVVKHHPIIDSLGRKQEARIISESDLYRLIANSKLDSAQKFEAWIFEEVLPAIRKTGAYSANHYGQQANQRHDVKTLLEADQLLISAINAAKACGQDHNTAVNSANQSTIDVLGVDVLARLGIKVEKKPTPAQAKPKKQPKQFDGQQALFNYMCEIFKDAIIAANQEKRRATFPVMCNRRPVIRTFSNRDIFRIIETLADNGEIVIDRTRKSTCYRLNGDC